MVLSFLLHTLCAMNFCLPHYQQPEIDNSYIELRSDLHLSPMPLVNPPTVGPMQGTLMKTIKGRSLAAFMGIPCKCSKKLPLTLKFYFPWVSNGCRGHKNYISFTDAESPVGNLRFAPPVPKKKWDRVLSTEKTSPLCLQLDASQYWYITGREDCLYMNIYTPNVSNYKFYLYKTCLWIKFRVFYSFHLQMERQIPNFLWFSSFMAELM